MRMLIAEDFFFFFLLFWNLPLNIPGSATGLDCYIYNILINRSYRVHVCSVIIINTNALTELNRFLNGVQ